MQANQGLSAPVSTSASKIRAALYVRVSTNNQTTENQRRELLMAAEQRGWTITAEYSDEGISGTKGRDKRPGLDAMLKAVAKGKVDVVMAWSVDRLARSITNLMAILGDVNGAGANLFLLQSGLDTTTPSGRAVFGILGVVAELERSLIVERVNAGLARARATGTKSGKAIGRPRVSPATEQAIRAALATGKGMLRVAKECGVGCGTVQRIAHSA
jgi:DNA invertase Pin-like site-specific DNA recombinase